MRRGNARSRRAASSNGSVARLDALLSALASSGLLQFDFDANAASPLVNKGAFGSGGNLLDDTGGCAIGAVGGAFNGKRCYSPLAGSGGYLRTGVLAFGSGQAFDGMNPPCHMIVVGRFGGSPSVNLIMAGGGSTLRYQDATHANFTAGGALNSAASDPLLPHLYDIFHHGQGTRFGVDGAFTSGGTVNPGPARLIVNGSRLAIGAATNGAARSTCDVARVLIFDNRIPYAQYTQLLDLLNAVYGLSAAKHASYVQPEDDTVAAPGFSLAKVIPFLGQSNASNYATVAPTNTWSAGTSVFKNDLTWITPGADPFDDETNQRDPVSIDSVSTNFGWAAPLAKAEATRYGVNVCIVPCARSATTMAEWQKGAVGLKRGYLYGSAVWRMKKALENGGTIPYVIVHQGESEAQGTQGQRDAWAALAQQFVADIRADLGLPNLPFLFALVRNNTMAAGYTDMHDNKIPSIASVPNKIFTFDVPAAGPFEADGVHIQGTGLDDTATNAQAAAIAAGV